MTTNLPRIGFHYFPDTAHYRQIDLDTWLPELQRFGAGGVTLLAPPQRAIPERFIAGMIAAGIEPTVHFPFHCRVPAAQAGVRLPAGDETGQVVPGCIPLPDACPPLDTLRLLLSAYARWGVRRVAFFDRPNLRAMWSPSDWLQGDLVEQFLDRFLPVATLALEAGLQPVFPPLVPGGDYWDLSFLRSALRGLKRRGAGALLGKLILSAEAFTGKRPLEWGQGGPERWPAARPYHTPSGAQDHLGFRIFDWYLAIARQELRAPLPIVLLRAGERVTGIETAPAAGEPEDAQAVPVVAPSDPGETDAPLAPAGARFAAGVAHARRNLAVAELLSEAPQDGGLPAEVLAGHFWLLSAAPRSSAAAECWFSPAGRLLPVVSAFQAWAVHRLGLSPAAPVDPIPSEPPAAPAGGAGADPEDELKDPSPLSPAPEGGGQAPSAPPPASEGEAGPEAENPAAEPAAGDPTAGTAKEPPASIPQAELHPAAASAAGRESGPGPSARPGSIDHYILLPLYAWGAADWDLALVQPLIQQGHATIGFSLTEARLARRVTVVGGSGAVSADALEMLRRNGCQVERLMEDGTLIASNS